ncbi:class I SAM-dependent methyltransferase [Rhodovibrionaceae bacterium A322]
MSTSLRGRWRRFKLGLPTLLGMARRGFFIPYRYADTLAPAGQRPGYPEVEALFAAKKPEFEGLLAALDRYAEDLTAIGQLPPPEPRFGQDWFPRLDAAVFYTLLRERKPARLVEVGSGHSTRFIMRAVKDGGLDTAVTAIDPVPRADLAGLPLTLERQVLQKASWAAIDALQAGDVLSIDSSHILMPGTDLDVFFGRILPRLPSGVLLHVHDILLPDDYPASWDWRGYNEQLAFLPLVFSDQWDVLWSSHYAATRLEKAVAGSVAGQLELRPGALETSLWLEKL